MPATIFRCFPDFLLHLDPDMAFFYVYFLTGWWLYREREALPVLADRWLSCAVMGLGTLAASTWLAELYAGTVRNGMFSMVRCTGYGLYSLSAAFSAFAFLGLFQKHFDHPSRVWRYLADTALWVYLVHQPIVVAWLAALRPLGLPWWVQTPIVAAASTAVAFLLYECIVRPTPLVQWFGPATGKRPALQGVR